MVNKILLLMRTEAEQEEERLLRNVITAITTLEERQAFSSILHQLTLRYFEVAS